MDIILSIYVYTIIINLQIWFFARDNTNYILPNYIRNYPTQLY